MTQLSSEIDSAWKITFQNLNPGKHTKPAKRKPFIVTVYFKVKENHTPPFCLWTHLMIVELW